MSLLLLIHSPVVNNVQPVVCVYNISNKIFVYRGTTVFIPGDSLPGGIFPGEVNNQISPFSPARSPRIRYLTICQAGILAAAICGIDLYQVIDKDADFTLNTEKKNSVSSREGPSFVSLTPSTYHRRMQANGTLRTSNSVDIYGTYRRRRDDDNHSSRQYLFDLSTADLSQTSSQPPPAYTEKPYSEQNTVRLNDDALSSLSQASSNQALGRYRRNSMDNHLDFDLRQQSKSASPVRRVSPTDVDRGQYEAKPQRPKTLNVTPEHSVTEQQYNYRYNISKSTSVHQAFTNSNTSSSSQSPASTPSPKLLNKSQNLIDLNSADKVRTSRPHANHILSHNTNSGTRPRPPNVKTFNQHGVKQSNATVTKQTDFIAFI